MHLNMRAIQTLIAISLLTAWPAGAVLAQQSDQEKAIQSQPDPHTPPPAQPIDPAKAAAREAQDKAIAEKKKQSEPAKPKNGNGSAAAPRSRTMQFTLPPVVAIAEVPRGKAVIIQGQVLSPQPTTFVLNDGNASMVINLGPDWRQLSKVRAGDRIGVIGQMDPYGAPLFRATGIVLDTGRIVIIPNS